MCFVGHSEASSGVLISEYPKLGLRQSRMDRVKVAPVILSVAKNLRCCLDHYVERQRYRM